jgi:predicted TIM-barrel fold metal-dependent hydrolase
VGISSTAAGTEEVNWGLYSCDDHIDMWALPPDLWSSRLSKSQREAGPHVVDRDGVPTWVVGDSVLGVSGMPTAGARGALARAGLEGQWQRPSTPELRLADMDRDGLVASVMYGPAVLGLPIEDPELKQQCWQAWNDWAAEFNAYDPDRLAALPVLPTHSPEAAASELERAAAAGHRGALVHCFEFDCGDPSWDRLWAAAQDTGLPISFHIGGGMAVPPADSWRAAVFTTVIAMQLATPLVSMVFSGALERHPGMRLVVAEAGLGWVPYVVNRMDGTFKKYAGVPRDYALSELPSSVFGRQAFVTFEEETQGATFVELLGAASCMWASDYPHADSTFPESRSAIVESFGGLSPDDCRQITAENCKSLYGFA